MENTDCSKENVGCLWSVLPHQTSCKKNDLCNNITNYIECEPGNHICENTEKNRICKKKYSNNALVQYCKDKTPYQF